MKFLLSRWLWSFVGTALLAALVWVFGPLLAPLEPWFVRAGIIALFFVIWLVTNLLVGRRSTRADDDLVRGVAKGPTPTETASAEEAAAMGERLTTALSLLKRARGTRGYLYEQPWYVIIGPPGAGKTTALLNAGLQFPLAAEMGQGAVAGAGGTRMCDWWFTDQAVLIDTAGRYTTQDSDGAVDRAGWEAFLDLLKRTRQRQPINGVLVAIALNDIATASAPERTAHAQAIRKRVRELTDRLGVRVPVYALLTKADLLAGFTEFFDDLDREKRAQVWGVTFPLATAGDAGPVPGFGAEFQALVKRIEERLIDRLQAERNPEKRALIAGFPAQVASLQQPVSAFLQEAFGGTKLDPAPFLRGVYLTSGTQEGTPIDRLTGALSRTFGVDQRRARSLQPTQGRSYFLGRLLSGVIFNEAMLVSARPGAGRKRVLVRAGAFAALLLVTLGAAGLVWRSRAANLAEIDETATALAGYETTAKPLPLDPVGDSDLPKIVPLLDQARALPHGFGSGEGGGSFGLGLSQDGKLSTASHAVYRHALERAFLPRLLWRLETQIRSSLNQPALAYEATRVYLMLGNAGPLDRDLVRTWEILVWGQTYPGAAAAPFREDLARHLDVLLADPLPSVGLDGALIEDARRTFSRVPLAERVYSRIKPIADRQGIAPWRPSEAAGASGVRVFLRGSGKPLTEGIPGLYTIDGFHKVVLRSLPVAARQVADESWVLGQSAAIDPASPQMQSLERDVVKLYTDEYAQVWDAMLADLNVVPLRGLGEAVQELYVLSSPQSPMRDLLTSIARQLTLSVPPPAPPGAAAGAVAAATAAAQAAETSAAAQLQGVLGAAAAPPPEPPGKVIDDRYKPLRDFVGTGPGAPIDGILKLLNDLQVQLNTIASTPPGAAAAPMLATGADPAKLIVAEAQRQPAPVSRWLAAMASSGGALRGGGAKQQLDDALNAPGGPADLCAKAVTGRYPFVPGATAEIPMDDFARLFAPGGLLDTFFNTQARAFVDTSGATWKPQDVNGVAAPISAGNVAQFQRAQKIRDLFFGAGGTTPTVRFDVTPGTLDNTSTQVTFDFDGTVVQYAHGPQRATQVTWPGQNRMTNVRLTFDPPPAGGAPVQASGPWALFRVVQMGSLQGQGSADRYTLAYKVADRQASFDVRAGSVLNPFAPGVLSDFRCPSSR